MAEKLVEYLSYKTTYESAGPKEDIPDFFERIMPEIALELYVLSLRHLTVCLRDPLQVGGGGLL